MLPTLRGRVDELEGASTVSLRLQDPFRGPVHNQCCLPFYSEVCSCPDSPLRRRCSLLPASYQMVCWAAAPMAHASHSHTCCLRCSGCAPSLQGPTHLDRRCVRVFLGHVTIRRRIGVHTPIDPLLGSEIQKRRANEASSNNLHLSSPASSPSSAVYRQLVIEVGPSRPARTRHELTPRSAAKIPFCTNVGSDLYRIRRLPLHFHCYVPDHVCPTRPARTNSPRRGINDKSSEIRNMARLLLALDTWFCSLDGSWPGCLGLQ